MSYKKEKLGFIGAGNMASAIIGGIYRLHGPLREDIYVSDIDSVLLRRLESSYTILRTTNSNTLVAQQSDIVFLCVKPDILEVVIDEIRDFVRDKLIVSIAAGKSLEWIRRAFDTDVKIIRAMPNTPVAVACGMTAICATSEVAATDLGTVVEIFESIGRAKLLPEPLFDAFIGVAGSAPAYGFMFIEAMADAGVKHGLSRADALNFSAQALLGAAQMVLNGSHPAALKDAVCSPDGTTIEAVATLEAHGFRNAIIQAVSSCVE
jgi:pyrroline-5-carboxylate reductase